jgi:uncharacterized protein (DUF2141 family)
MKKSLILCLLLSVSLTTGCLLEDGKDEEGTGTIKVTVNTDANIWTYPKSSLAYNGAADYKFKYTEVGGDGTLGTLPAGYYTGATWSDNGGTKNITGKEGTLKNYVYLFSTIEQKSDNNPVLYKGESSTNGAEITISDIEPGTYYVVAFYDYTSGGNLENILNRYDRYAIYAETSNALSGNSTPYFDKASIITINEDQTVSITLDIAMNWVIGKPKADNRTDLADANTATITFEMGRYFLKDLEAIPTP